MLVLCVRGLCGQAEGSGVTLTIDQAVQEAIGHNLDLLAEKYNLSVAEARVVTARLRPNPVLSIGGDHLDLLGTGYDSINQAGPQEYSVRTDFLLERAHKRANRIAVAEGSRAVVELQLLNTVRTLVLDVQNAYVEALLAKDNLTLAEENLKAFGDIVEVNRKRVASGDLAEVELLRTELAQLQYESAVRQASLRLRTARVKLQLLLGRGKAEPPADVTGQMRRDRQPVAAADLEKTALEWRPDLRALKRDEARSLADVRLQLAQGKVDYTVGTEYRRQQGLAGKGNSLGVFFSTNIPVFNKNQGEIERARQEQRQIEARMKALTATIQSEVETAHLQYTNALKALERLEGTMLSKAKDVRQITEFAYRRGEATLVELLDAQRAYNETIQSYNEARAEFARSLYLMDSASGKAATR
jgi:cobalt-zinc-cadmium efflux system outer membrane protein